MNKGRITKQLSTVGDWGSITLGSLGPSVEHMAQNDPTGGARKLGYLHTNSHVSDIA